MAIQPESIWWLRASLFFGEQALDAALPDRAAHEAWLNRPQGGVRCVLEEKAPQVGRCIEGQAAACCCWSASCPASIQTACSQAGVFAIGSLSVPATISVSISPPAARLWNSFIAC